MVGLSDLVIPPQVKLAFKFAPWIIILLLSAALVWKGNQLKHRNEQLANERTSRGEIAKLVHGEDTWVSIRAHIRADQETSANRKRALDEISQQAAAAKARADKLDADLKHEQEDNARKFSKAQQTIDSLQKRKPTGHDADDINKDSQAAWKAWKNASLLPQESSYLYNHLQAETHITTLTVKLVEEPNYDSLRANFASAYKFNPKYLRGVLLYGWNITDPRGICEIHVVDPHLSWNSDKRQTLGHELAHCVYGGWHGDTF